MPLVNVEDKSRFAQLSNSLANSDKCLWLDLLFKAMNVPMHLPTLSSYRRKKLVDWCLSHALELKKPCATLKFAFEIELVLMVGSAF